MTWWMTCLFQANPAPLITFYNAGHSTCEHEKCRHIFKSRVDPSTQMAPAPDLVTRHLYHSLFYTPWLGQPKSPAACSRHSSTHLLHESKTRGASYCGRTTWQVDYLKTLHDNWANDLGHHITSSRIMRTKNEIGRMTGVNLWVTRKRWAWLWSTGATAQLNTSSLWRRW